MSFGQRRIIELLRAILLAPPLLLLDEPFNFLDPEKREAVASVLASDELARTSLVLSTHHSDELSGLAASSYLFQGGLPVCRLADA
jgi:ABC-type molybdenum transport system ATPase subunit/photorepair protein PhrA